MHFMPNNNLGENISHFILNTPKKFLPPKIAFKILGTQKLHLGNQVPGSRKFSCPGSTNPESFMKMVPGNVFLAKKFRQETSPGNGFRFP